MKLHELSIGDTINIGKQADAGDHNALQKWMFRNGYRKIGQGSFTAVYEKSKTSKYVVRVSSDPDKCWISYAELARTSKNPHFLRIRGFKDIGKTPGIYVAITERLTNLTRLHAQNLTREHIQQIAWMQWFATHNIDPIEGAGWRTFLQQARGIPSNEIPNEARLNSIAQRMERSNDQFVAAGKAIHRISEHSNCPLDLHRGNVMMRGTTLVFVDPLWEGLDDTFNTAALVAKYT